MESVMEEIEIEKIAQEAQANIDRRLMKDATSYLQSYHEMQEEQDETEQMLRETADNVPSNEDIMDVLLQALNMLAALIRHFKITPTGDV